MAFLFPGQGAADFRPESYRSLPEAARLVDYAGTILGVDPWKPDPGFLDSTLNLQPLLTAVTLGIHSTLLLAGLRPDAVTGHSLGEIAAWSAAGCVPSEAAVRVAAIRGRLMQRRAETHPGGMLALLVEDPEPAVRLGRRRGSVQLAAHNAPKEWVLSGDRPALAAVASAFRSEPLRVAGAWHGPSMQPAVGELLDAMRAEPQEAPGVPFVSNRSGEIPTAGEDLPGMIAGQLIHRVEWARTMKTLWDLGITDYVTLGPGKVLRGLVRKNLGALAQVHSTHSPEGIARTLEVLGR